MSTQLHPTDSATIAEIYPNSVNIRPESPLRLLFRSRLLYNSCHSTVNLGTPFPDRIDFSPHFMTRMSSIASSSRSILRKGVGQTSKKALTRSNAISLGFGSRSISGSESGLRSLAPASAAGVGSIQSRRSFFSLPDIHKLAGLISPSSEEGTDKKAIETDGDVQRFHARKILP
jgi:hypothetical protein